MSEQPSLKEVLFPVERWNVFVAPPAPRKPEAPKVLQPSLRLEVDQPQMTPAPEHHAIVDVERRRVFAVVSQNYELVTNERAIQLGKERFRQVFSQNTLDEMELYNVVMPSTRSFCHVDFTLRGYEFKYGSSDAWKPFLRVTNSYNKTKPLQFDLGFCRHICRNGVIFGARQVHVKRYHSQAEAAATRLAGIDFTELKRLETQFLDRLHNLGRYAVPPAMMLPLACKVFDWNVTPEQLNKPRGRDRIRALGDWVHDLTDWYFHDLGHNGYAALNVLTDFASRPVELAFAGASKVQSLQEQSGNWIDEFLPAVESRDFRFEQYVGPYLRSAELIESVRQVVSNP